MDGMIFAKSASRKSAVRPSVDAIAFIRSTSKPTIFPLGSLHPLGAHGDGVRDRIDFFGLQPARGRRFAFRVGAARTARQDEGAGRSKHRRDAPELLWSALT